ncbi:MAG: LysM peptidoglycan-binding domain-containing protein [Candidatus Gastranaerophilaceae bacterium]
METVELFKSTAPENTTKSLSGESQNDNPVYTVKKGDTLFSVAKANGVSVEDLKKANGLKDNTLSLGQKLRIPAKSNAAIFPAAKNANNGIQMYREISDEEITKENTRNKFVKIIKNPDYVIKEGDTAGTVAKKFNVSTEALLALNAIDEKKLKIGQTIKIPERREAKNVKSIEDAAKATGFSLDYLKSLEKMEEKHNKIYTDKNGVKTIGIGHALDAGETGKYSGKTLTDTQIYTMLAQDILDREQNIRAIIGDDAYKKMPQAMKDSVMDFVFNRGETVFENHPGFVSSLKSGDYSSAIAKMNVDYSVMKFKSSSELQKYINQFDDKRMFVVEKDGKTLKKFLSGLDKRRLFEISHASNIYKGKIPDEIINSAQKVYQRGLYFMSIETANGLIKRGLSEYKSRIQSGSFKNA